MVNNFPDIRLNDLISDSLQKLLNRDITTLTFSAGTEFPQEVTEAQIGRLCHRIDTKTLWALTSFNPIKWEIILDYSKTYYSIEEVNTLFQPLAPNLTIFSKVAGGANSIPYFVTPTEMSTLTITQFGKDLFTAASMVDVRDRLLGLGALATKSIINGATDIENNSITEDKLGFVPLKSVDAYITGDMKETLSDEGEGWVKHTYQGTIGNADSGATIRANTDTKELFKLLWQDINIVVLPVRGASSEEDFNANKTVSFPRYEAIYEGSNIYIKL